MTRAGAHQKKTLPRLRGSVGRGLVAAYPLRLASLGTSPAGHPTKFARRILWGPRRGGGEGDAR
jgi:hypothetical protein